jgi:hypothetical protein
VSDEQVIAQAIKALRAGPLHSHLVREQPKTVPELYDQFAKFSKSEIQHFHKPEQQRKVAKQTKLQEHAMATTTVTTQSHWNKRYREPSHHLDSRTLDQRSPQSNQRGGASNRGRGRGQGPYMPRPLYCMYHGNETDNYTKDCPIYIDTKWKMNQGTTQPSPQLQYREVNHTMQWALHN